MEPERPHFQNAIAEVEAKMAKRCLGASFPDVFKDPGTAKLCREKGDDYHSRKLYYDAIVAYNRSIAHAETKSSELGLLYAKRSAVYFDAKIYSKCRENIDLARKNNFPADRMAELDARKAACLDKDGIFDPWSFFKIESSHKTNEKVPFIADCLELINGLQYGRHIVTNKNLNAGEFIAIEEPYFAMWYDASDVYRCKACMNPNHGSLIPCPKCAKVMYCSNECRRNDSIHLWKHFDNPINYDLREQSYRLGRLMHNKALQITGGNLEETIGYLKNEGERTVFDYNWNSLDKEARDKAQLLCANTLTTNGLKPSPPDPRASKYDNLLFEFMFDQLRIFQTNSYYLHELRRDVAYPKRDTFDTTLAGSAVYLFSSLINNSCYPNVQQITIGNKLVLLVVRPIKANEQLFISYGYPFYREPRRYRQVQLLKHYGFVCLCPACKGGYDMLPQLPKVDKKFFEKRFTALPSPKEAISMFKQNCAYINKNIRDRPTYEIVKLIEENDNLLHSLGRADFIYFS